MFLDAIKKFIGKNKKRKILIGAVIAVVIFIIIVSFFKKGNGNLKLEKVARGTITQDVSETGVVKPTTEIKLGFKTSGRIDQINVKVGDIVEKGAELASLDKTSLFIQLSQAGAALAVAQAQYNKLLAGSTPEEIKVSEDARNAAQDDLNKAYQDALNTLNDAYLKIYNAYNAAGSIQASYFGTADQEGIKVQDNKTLIGDSLSKVKPLLDAAKTSLNHNPDYKVIEDPRQNRDDIDTALSEMEFSLKNTSDALKIIRETCEQGVYYSRVTSIDKTTIDNHRGYIITALTSVTNAKQTISSDKIAFQKAEDELALKQAKPRQEDIDYYRAKVKEAESNVDSYQHQIWDATLRAPISGIITRVDKKIGETVQATDLPISLISLDPFQIKVDIYEEDIVKVKLGNLVDIKVAAFPNKDLKGRVISVDPAEKVVDGVVYYEVTIGFDQPNEGLKPGMTADIVIKTISKENVLIISEEAVLKNGKTMVKVFKNGKIEEREIEVGLEGNDGKVEVISGLSEGEEVVIE